MAAPQDHDDGDDIPELVSLPEDQDPDTPQLASRSEDDTGPSQPSAGAAHQDSADSRAADRDVEEQKVPVTIVTGFLGAGKSTLLRHILTAAHGRRIAVLVNEFGDTVDVEREIRLRADTRPSSQDDGGGGAASGQAADAEKEGARVDDWIELPNGCMCCTMKDGAIRALESLMARAAAAGEKESGAANAAAAGGKRPVFDHIVIETTGLADPTPIVNMFWLDDAVLPTLALDGVVTVVDAVNLHRTLLANAPSQQQRRPRGPVTESEASADAETCKAQISVADVVILNKCDMLSGPPASAGSGKDEGDVAALVQQIATVNPFTKVVPTSYGKTALDHILDLRAYDAGRIDRQIAAMHLASPKEGDRAVDSGRQGQDEHSCCSGYDHDHEHEHRHGHDAEQRSDTAARSHIGAVKTAKLEFPPLRSREDIEAVEAIFQRILWRHTTQTVTDWLDPAPVPALTPAPDSKLEPDAASGIGAAAESAAACVASTGQVKVDILRTKGRLLASDDESAAWILQGVRDVYELVIVPRVIDPTATSNGNEEMCKVVFIGRKVETPLGELADDLRRQLGIEARLG